MPDDPFDKIDDIKHNQREKATEALRRREANARRDATIREFHLNHEIKLDEILKGYFPLFDRALFEFGSKVWGVTKTKKVEKKATQISKEIEVENPNFLIANTENFMHFNNPKYVNHPAFRYGRDIVGGQCVDQSFLTEIPENHYFIAATIRNITLKSVEMGEIQIADFNGSCIVGCYEHTKMIGGNTEDSYTYYENNLKFFATGPVELNAIKQALVAIYTKLNS